jgi:hypothetical protein
MCNQRYQNITEISDSCQQTRKAVCYSPYTRFPAPTASIDRFTQISNVLEHALPIELELLHETRLPLAAGEAEKGRYRKGWETPLRRLCSISTLGGWQETPGQPTPSWSE